MPESRVTPGRPAPDPAVTGGLDAAIEEIHGPGAVEAIEEAFGDHAEHTHVAPSTLRQREGDQPLPVVNDGPSVQDLVIADIEQRKQLGIERYGTELQPLNGRDTLSTPTRSRWTAPSTSVASWPSGR